MTKTVKRIIGFEIEPKVERKIQLFCLCRCILSNVT